MSGDYAERIITAINSILERTRGLRIDSHQAALFCMDDDVDYGSVWRIDRAKLIPTAKVPVVLDQLAAGGPSWIHANLIDTNESLPLITIRVGQSLGNPNPSINTSVEIDKVVKIVDR